MEEELQKLGLKEAEAKVYLALLELGPATVTEITRKAGITRTLGYHTLEKLGWYGLVNRVSGKEKKITYTAQHPQRLLQFVKSKKNLWEKRTASAENFLPKLLSIYRVAEKPVIKYQEGISGLQNIYSETLDSKTEILSILDAESWDTKEMRGWANEYIQERSRRKIHERVLMLDTKIARVWMKNYQGSSKYTQHKWINLDELPGILDFGGELNVYENKVVMALFKPNKIGISIESTALTTLLKALFELAWKKGVETKK